MTVDETLAERAASYGEFKDGARIAMNLFAVVQSAPGYGHMTPDKQYAMFMFCAKMARVLNGDPEHADSYHDIAGYAKLVEDRCQTS